MTAKIYSFRATAPLFPQRSVLCCGTSGPENRLGDVLLGANERMEVRKPHRSQSQVKKLQGKGGVVLVGEQTESIGWFIFGWAWVRFLKFFPESLIFLLFERLIENQGTEENQWPDHGNGKTSREWRGSSRRLPQKKRRTSESEAIVLDLDLSPRVSHCSARPYHWSARISHSPGPTHLAAVYFMRKKSEHMVSQVRAYWWRALCRNSKIWTLLFTRSNYLYYMCWQVAATIHLPSKTDKENFKNVWY